MLEEEFMSEEQTKVQSGVPSNSQLAGWMQNHVHNPDGKSACPTCKQMALSAWLAGDNNER